MDNSTYTYTSFLTAPRCNAQSELSVASLTSDLIEVATEHANRLDIGYQALIPEGIAWVLSRLNISMIRYPRMHETYAIHTWVQSFNRSFSERNFQIVSAHTGEVLGYARSVWTAIDIKLRKLGNLARFVDRVPLLPDRACQAPEPARIPLPDSAVAQTRLYKFCVSDIDFNRHVNTVRYVEMIINNLPLAVYDAAMVSALSLSFRHEAVYGQTALISHTPDGYTMIADADHPEAPFVVAHVQLTPRR